MLEYIPPLLCGGASGLALFLSGPPTRWWGLQLIALLPWLVALCASSHPGIAAAAGAGFAACYLIPLVRELKLFLALGMGLGMWQGFLWISLSICGHFILRSPGPENALAFACLATLFAWADYTLVPMFGTAQCFVRPLSKVPRLIQFAQLTGVPGIVWVMVAGQALVAHGFQHKIPAEFGLAALGWALILLFNEWSWARPPLGSVRVAAAGWTEQWDPIALIKGPYRKYLQEASVESAQLLVTPETGFQFLEREEWLNAFSKLACQHNMALAVGFFDQSNLDNRILFLNAGGEWQGEYRKTHLVPFFENYNRGDGKLVEADLEGWKLGGVICQDDNFNDLTNAYGRANTHILAVPTNDWRAVKDFHFENSIIRAVEGRFAIVRAASNGISAIISPRGEVLRKLDHYRGGPGVIIADVPVYSGVTLYSRLGNWWVFVSAVGLVVWWVL